MSREEIRAIFVLGVIGVLISAKDVFGVQLGFTNGIGSIISFLLLYWGAYIFLMTIGVSDDWIAPSIAARCAKLAGIAFVSGIAGTLAGTVDVTLASIFPTALDSLQGELVLGSIGAIVGAYAVHKLREGIPSSTYL